jgi:hypothetical protein
MGQMCLAEEIYHFVTLICPVGETVGRQFQRLATAPLDAVAVNCH